MSNILVVAEHANGKLNASTARAVNCASKIGGNITVLVLGAAPEGAAAEAAQIAGVTAVQTISNPANDTPVSAILAPQIAAAAAGFSHVLGPNTTFGKDLMPRVAALLGVGQVTDISAVHGARRFERPIYAGNAVTTIDVPGDGMVVGTVRCASWAAAGQGGSAAVSAITVNATIPSHTRYKGLQAGGGDRPDLQSASRVVSGGRGVGSGENFKVIFSLADKLGAGVGASRAAVDAGYVPNDMQVGQTGKIIAPELYVAVGISGAIQHLAGIKDAGTIVAINSDPEAPIFEVADIGLVGDLFQLLPALESALS